VPILSTGVPKKSAGCQNFRWGANLY